MKEKLDNTKTALIDASIHWRRITDKTPRGKKMFLINEKARSATIGVLGTDEAFFTHYFPIPTFGDPE